MSTNSDVVGEQKYSRAQPDHTVINRKKLELFKVLENPVCVFMAHNDAI